MLKGLNLLSGLPKTDKILEERPCKRTVPFPPGLMVGSGVSYLIPLRTLVMKTAGGPMPHYRGNVDELYYELMKMSFTNIKSKSYNPFTGLPSLRNSL